MELWIDEVSTPIGVIALVVEPDSGSLCGLEFGSELAQLRKHLEARYGETTFRRVQDPHGIASRLRAYFDGDVAALDSVPVSTGGTPFQERVWHALRSVPAGATATYGEIAATVGKPGAARAVGLANAMNPVALVVPCHRIIGADGTLTGYGGGLDRKRWLLAHEMRHAAGGPAPELPFAAT
jgi:methylated-DNA-[protein]-cysteine S-methyltransferase